MTEEKVEHGPSGIESNPDLIGDAPGLDQEPEVVVTDLSGQQRALAEALIRKSKRGSAPVLRMYVAALQAMSRADEPEALHIAAYELREFMIALPSLLAVPVDKS